MLNEARAAAALNHPNIVTIYEVGRQTMEPDAKIDFIAMGFVPGRTLHDSIKAAAPVPLDEVLHYAIQIADAMVAAHTAGITHRDLKPANIIVTEKRRVKVLDFGIAQRLGGPGDLEKTRTADLESSFGVGGLGTLRYMSPEQVQNKTVDTRSDIFAR
ncbi:MAG: serine/threonine protein kinase [Acidobacteria bacterium]|nr:serine/threonine protein kinase [Acidobacteriota bacterium]